jgi:hypothetical protein
VSTNIYELTVLRDCKTSIRPLQKVFDIHLEFYAINNRTTESRIQVFVNMLAARDQENLMHGYQQVAASKSLNQGARGAPPKTPGTKYPKTPLKVPIYDENAPAGFGHIKSVLGTRVRALEGLMTSGKLVTNLGKDDFVTPMGMWIETAYSYAPFKTNSCF